MRNEMLTLVGLATALTLTGACGDDGDTRPTDDGGPADTGTADTGTADTGTADTGTPDTGAPDTGMPDTGMPDAATADAGDAGGGTGPVITEIAWEPDGACEMNTPSDMIVTVTVEDPDTAEGDLTFSGGAAGCMPIAPNGITAAESTLNCPQANPYMGSVTVSDGVDEDTRMFTMPVCDTGSTTF